MDLNESETTANPLNGYLKYLSCAIPMNAAPRAALRKVEQLVWTPDDTYSAASVRAIEKDWMWKSPGVLFGKETCFSETQKFKEKLGRRENVVLSKRMRAFCAYIALINPSGGKLEEIREKKNQSKACEYLSATTLLVNNLLNEQFVPGAHLNVSIVVFRAFRLCIFLFAYRHLYDDDNRD